MADDPVDSLFDRLVDHYEGRRRLVRRGPDSGGKAAKTRRTLVRRSGGAIGQLKVASVMNRADVESSRRLTWTPNVQWESGYEPPEGERGATTTEIATWHAAIVAIESGLAST
jgi:hypothetical protein